MMQSTRPFLWGVLLVSMLIGPATVHAAGHKTPGFYPVPSGAGYCLSWRVGVEAGNIRLFHSVPPRCTPYIAGYMLRGQYQGDLALVAGEAFAYLHEVAASDDGKDAWVLDVDDTCISNLFYYQGKRFGGDPYDPLAFKSWAERGMCPAIPPVLWFYRRLIQSGFKVFLVTGRDEETLRPATAQNLFLQGFVGHERLIMRRPEDRGVRAAAFKSAARKQLAEEGYRIRGNMGDQWTDLVGDCAGDRTFKLPNPMYYVP